MQWKNDALHQIKQIRDPASGLFNMRFTHTWTSFWSTRSQSSSRKCTRQQYSTLARSFKALDTAWYRTSYMTHTGTEDYALDIWVAGMSCAPSSTKVSIRHGMNSLAERESVLVARAEAKALPSCLCSSPYISCSLAGPCPAITAYRNVAGSFMEFSEGTSLPLLPLRT